VTPSTERARRLWAEGIVHRRDHSCDRAVDLLRQATLEDPGDIEAATLLASLLIRRASAWANGQWAWSSDWIDHYPYDDGDPDGDAELGADYFHPWPDVIAGRDEAERLLNAVLATAPNDAPAAALDAVLWLDRWETYRMLAQELDDPAVGATGAALRDRAPLVLRRAEEVGVRAVASLIRADAAAAGVDLPASTDPDPKSGRWSWYVIRRGCRWHANGEPVNSVLVTTDPNELRWAHDAWSATSTSPEAPFVFEAYQAGDLVQTLDLAAGPLPSAVPPLVGDPLPSGLPAVILLNQVPLIVHNGYSVDVA
jgi:hypothetical protein